MPTVADVLTNKAGRGVAAIVTVAPEDRVLDAVKVMNDHRIGSVIVVDRQTGKMAGIFTERDLLTRVVAEGRSPEQTTVNDVMTKRVVCCSRDTNADELRAVIREKHVRHIPVVDDEKPVGMVSIGDLNMAHAQELEQTVQYLELYLRS
ncbi:MAG: CBS domain-containing protein [Phycisphaeraceae bacterium]|nr:CBS domain-containing protein [Phycisphaeraceae bacterium]MBX3368528.1 CBS domain-containing protein [Phycisphaeraceae bacterium]